MAIDFAGTETEAFTVLNSTVVENTTAGRFEAGVVRCAIDLGNAAGTWAETRTFTATTTKWIHFDLWAAGVGASLGSGRSPITLYNSSGTAVFRLTFSANATLQAQYWSGSAWVNIGSTFTAWAASARYTFDLKVICGASGSFELWSGGSALLLSGSASMSAVDNIAKARFEQSASNILFISQVIVSDQSTIGHRYYSKPPTGNGANTAWTGAFGDVDETVLSTTDFIESTVANDVETFTGAAISIPTGVVKAVVVSTQSKNAASGPQNIQGCLRKGGVNYFSPNISGIGVNYAPIQAIFETDPSTSTAWSLSDASAATLEFGVRSQA